MKQREEIKEEISNISGIFENIDKKDIFVVPENYFQQLSAEIFEKTIQHKNHETQFIPYFWLKIGLAAASLAVIFYLVWQLNLIKPAPKYSRNPELYALEFIDSETFIEFYTELNQNDNQEILNQTIDEIDENLIMEEL